MKLLENNDYKRLCESVAMFAEAKELDAKSREQLATLIALAVRIGFDSK